MSCIFIIFIFKTDFLTLYSICMRLIVIFINYLLFLDTNSLLEIIKINKSVFHIFLKILKLSEYLYSIYIT